MSEYSSLYINIEITEEKLNQFFLDKPVSQVLDDEWQGWWDSRKMYGKQSLEQLPVYGTATNRDVFDELLQDRDFGAKEFYDSASKRWIFIAVFFSENYNEILPMLSLLKSLASYKESTQRGVAFIYDFCWGHHEVMAYLEFADQKALLKEYITPGEIASVIIEEADRRIEQAVADFNNQFKD